MARAPVLTAMEYFELIANAFVAFAGLTFAGALFLRENRERIHVLTGIFVLLVAAGSAFRALGWVFDLSWLHWLNYICFSLFPLAGLLLFERLTARAPSIAAKVLTLGLTLALVLSLVVAPSIYLDRAWLAVLATWHLGAILYAMGMCFESARAASTSDRLKSVCWSLVVGLSVCAILATLDWLNRFGFHAPRLGTLALLLLIHLFYRIFNSTGDFSLRQELSRAGSLFFGVSIFVICASLLPMEKYSGISYVLQLGILAAMCTLPALFMQHYWLRIRGLRPSPLLARVNHLPMGTLQDFVTSLTSLQEVTDAKWISSAEALGLSTRVEFGSESYLTHDQIDQYLRRPDLSSMDRDRFEKLRHLILVSGLDSICFINAERGFLAFGFSSYMDQNHYRELALLLTGFARLLKSEERAC